MTPGGLAAAQQRWLRLAAAVLVALPVTALASGRRRGNPLDAFPVVIALCGGPESFARAPVPPDGFLNDPARFAAAVLRTNAAPASTVVFRNLRPGRHAVIAFHDVNGNGKLDRSFFGVPLEPHGFSNAVPRSFRPPTFAEAAIELDGGESDIRIKLIAP